MSVVGRPRAVQISLLLLTLIGLFCVGCDGDGGSHPPDTVLRWSAASGSTGRAPSNPNVGPGTGEPASFAPGHGPSPGPTPPPSGLTLLSIEAVPNAVFLSPGDSLIVSVYGNFSDGEHQLLPGDTGVSLSFLSGDPDVVSIASGDILIGESDGATVVTVSATYQGQTVTFPIEVTVSTAPPRLGHLVVANPTFNSGSGSLTVFAVELDGTLTPLSDIPQVNRPVAIARSNNGQYLYAGNYFSYEGTPASNLGRFFRNPADGSVAYLSPAVATITGDLQRLLSHPLADYLYAFTTNGTITKFAIQTNGFLIPNPDSEAPLATGATLLTGVGFVQPVMSPGGDRLYVPHYDNDELHVVGVDPLSGVLGTVQTISTGLGSGPAGVSVSPDGSLLYVSAHDGNSVRVYGNVVGQPTYLTQLSTLTVTGAHVQLTHPTAPLLFVTSNDQIVTLETDASALIWRDIDPTGHDPTQILLDPTGEYLYVICRGITGGAPSAISAFHIDLVDGTLTKIQDYEFPELQFTSGAVMLDAP